MKTLLLAVLVLATNAFAYDALKIYTIPNASAYKLNELSLTYELGQSGNPRVGIIAHRKDGLRGHPELSVDYFTASVPGLTHMNGDFKLVYEGVHLCAETIEGRVEEAGECEFMVETNSRNEIEISIVVNH